MSPHRALWIASTGDPATLRHHLRRLARGSVAHYIVRSVLCQTEANVSRAVAALGEARRRADQADLDVLDELIGPLWVSLARYDDVDRLLERAPHSPRYALSRRALRSVVAAARGDSARAREERQGIADATARCDDDLLTAFSYQRCGLSAYYAGAYQEAIEWELGAAQMLRRIGAHRGAAIAYSVLYAIHHAVTGDTEAAYEFAQLQIESARACGNTSIEISGLVAQYELAAELADDQALVTLRSVLRKRALPQQYCERFANGLADALPHAWDRDFAAFRANVIVLQEVHSRTKHETALCYALRALADASLGDVVAARRHSRSAIATSSLVATRSMSAHELKYARLARAIAGSACVLVGDGIRGRRAFEAKAMRDDPAASGFLEVLDGASWTKAARQVRGFARAVAAAKELIRSAESSASPLTPAENRVLRLLAHGFSATEIALELHRSVFTVRVHAKSIIAKFNVHSRLAAIAYARRFGYLP